MNIMKLFPSQYVTAEDLGDKEHTLTMRTVQLETMDKATGEVKPVLYFEKATKGLVLNKTNAMMVSHLHGPETDNWQGKRITIYPTRVKAFGKMTSAIRVKNGIPSASRKADDGDSEAMTTAEDIA